MNVPSIMHLILIVDLTPGFARSYCYRFNVGRRQILRRQQVAIDDPHEPQYKNH